MNYKDLDIKISYISYGNNNISSAFLVPALRVTKLYKRSVGYFSSGVFEPIIDGIITLARNHGKIQLVASPKLCPEDIAAINEGYRQKEEVVKKSFSNDFIEAIEGFNDEQLKLLVALIAEDVLDIKIAVTKKTGSYHDKLGVLEDFDGNRVVFYGSSNSSLNGYQENYEKIRVAKSWIQGQEAIIEDESQEFEDLWNNNNPFVCVYNYKESAQKNILQVISERSKKKSSKDSLLVELRDYQEKAISAWVANGFHGFYVMATGTGKTWTAIFSAKRLLESHKCMIVICAPYKHLLRQWTEDIVKVFPNAKIIMVSSENAGWETQITQEIIRKKYHPENQIIIISTIASFNTERFKSILSKSSEEKLLIVDEAHRFTNRTDEIKCQFNYMLGLSATPYSGASSKSGVELMDYFGGQVFSLPIEKALGKYLVNYYYIPIFVSATNDEEQRFLYHSQKIASCFKNNVCINPDLLVKSIRNRLRIISMAEEKISKIDEIINHVEDKDHFVVYCGDGKLFDNDSNEEIKHIRFVKQILDEHGYKPSQFTAKENMHERMVLVEQFNKGNITALSAIRCLDEGINIPSIKSALILSSNDDYREFVQRRGRILRQYPGKKTATIYDVIVLPTDDMYMWAKIELRRFFEYAKLAINFSDNESIFNELCDRYGLTIEDIDTYDYDDTEESIDE